MQILLVATPKRKKYVQYLLFRRFHRSQSGRPSFSFDSLFILSFVRLSHKLQCIAQHVCRVLIFFLVSDPFIIVVVVAVDFTTYIIDFSGLSTSDCNLNGEAIIMPSVSVFKRRAFVYICTKPLTQRKKE